jgi:hypothetical protein
MICFNQEVCDLSNPIIIKSGDINKKNVIKNIIEFKSNLSRSLYAFPRGKVMC